MSIKIEDIYDAIVTEIETQLTTYRRMPNPYFVEENTYLQLQKGYGVRIDSGRDTERYVGCLVTWERLFTIILVNQITTTQNNIGARELIEKGILVDHDTLIRAFYANNTLTGQGIKAWISDDSGIIPVSIGSNQAKFFQMELSLNVEYQEPK